MEATNLLAINIEQCCRVAGILKKLELRRDFYQREYLTLKGDRETLLAMHFYAVAICHQTHRLHHTKLNIWGWDYIEYAFVKLAKHNSQLLSPKYLTKADISEISVRLAKVFSVTANPEDTTLDRLEERAHLMKEASLHLMDHYNGKFICFFDDYLQQLVNAKNGLYRRLQKMEAFSDDKQKKSTFLIKLLTESDLIAVTDPGNFIPIMDYHMQRVLLRMGCVEIIDLDLRKKLLKRTPMQSDEPVRSFCINAFRLIAEKSKVEIIKLNDFFWSLGRSCCHETTLCKHFTCEKNPCTFNLIVNLENHLDCAFRKSCKGAENEDYRRLWQPVVETHFY
jgi:hypothetical protein